MKKICSLFLLFSLIVTSLFAANNAQHYDTISLYLHGTVMADAFTSSLSLPSKEDNANREGVALKVGVDAFKNEDLGAKFGLTADFAFDIPFRSVGNEVIYGKRPYLGLSSGLIFRSRPWDYIEISLGVKGVISTLDYESINLGLTIEPQADIYFDDYIYLKVSLSYGSDFFRFPFKGEYYLERSNLPSHFTLGVGCGYAFGGYSK